jgi:hypothetical protein
LAEFLQQGAESGEALRASSFAQARSSSSTNSRIKPADVREDALRLVDALTGDQRVTRAGRLVVDRRPRRIAAGRDQEAGLDPSFWMLDRLGEVNGTGQVFHEFERLEVAVDLVVLDRFKNTIAESADCVAVGAGLFVHDLSP